MVKIFNKHFAGIGDDVLRLMDSDGFTHFYRNLCIYIYIYVCVCVCVHTDINILLKTVILYFILNILYFNNSILSISTIYVMLARHEELPENYLLTSKHVAANHM
jgi:hypothetical protein